MNALRGDEVVRTMQAHPDARLVYAKYWSSGRGLASREITNLWNDSGRLVAKVHVGTFLRLLKAGAFVVIDERKPTVNVLRHITYKLAEAQP